MSEASETEAPEARAARRRSLLLRVGLTALALGLWWGLAGVGLAELGAALGRLAPGAFAAAVALTLVAHGVGALRWRLLLRAFGAKRRPSFGRATRLYLEGTFFNTFLPANVGGDVLRAHVTRDAFPEGAAGAYVVVLLERVFGLAGLFGLAGAVLGLRPVGELEPTVLPLLLSVLAFAGALALPWLLRRFGPWLPGGLGRIAAGVPAPRRPLPLAGALALSFGTHGLIALIGWTLLASLVPELPLADALVLVPVAMIATYLPTIGGLGTREAAFVLLFGWVGVGEAEATAGSLGIYGALVVVALFGGALHLLRGRSDDGG